MTWKNQEKDPCENNQHQMKKNGTLDFDTERDGPTFFCLILEPPSFFSFLLLRLSDFQTSLNLSFFSLPKYNTPCETKLTHNGFISIFPSLYFWSSFLSLHSFYVLPLDKLISPFFLPSFPAFTLQHFLSPPKVGAIARISSSWRWCLL